MYYKDITPDYLCEHDIQTEGLIFGQSFLPYNPRLKQFSRELRKARQLAEVKLWKCLRAKSMGYSFKRQSPILNYIADFYCKELDLVVEVDGNSHFSAKARKKDAERDRQMQALGLKVIRVNDNMVRNDPERMAAWIIEQATQGGASDSPRPLSRKDFAQGGSSDSPLPPSVEGEARSDA